MRFCILLLFLCPRVPAAIISLGGSTVFMSDLVSPVPVDAFISVGYFDPGFSDFSSLPMQTWTDITASVYTEIGTGFINPLPGEWAGGGNAPGIEGEHLYVWVFGSPVVPSFIGEGEFGLFTGSSPDWTARGDGDITSPQFNFLNIDSVDTAIHGSDMGSNIALGSIPEPEQLAFFLGLTALMAVVRMKFRRIK